MDARAVTIRQLLSHDDPATSLSRPVQLRVPVFQRSYEWNGETVERLVLDLIDRSAAKPDAPAHFLGSIVLLDEPEAPGLPDALMVIDGQQRLLTLAVAIARLEARLDRSDSWLVNPGFGPAARPRLVPADVDRPTFQALLDRQPADPNRLLANAAAVFDRLTRHLDPAKLLAALLDRVQVVRIVLDRREDAESVFESLNTTGQPLTQADLVRTGLLAAFGTVDDQRGIDQLYWRPIEARLQAVVPDRQRSGRVSPRDAIVGEYLRMFLMRNGGRVDGARVYRYFAEHFDRSEREAEAFLRTLDRLSSFYASLRAVERAGTISASGVLNRLGYNVHHPLLLQLYERSTDAVPTFPASEIELAVTGLESYFIRRLAVGLRTNVLGRLFERVTALRPASAMAIWHELSDSWPSDTVFEKGVRETPIYRQSVNASRVMLERLDLASNEPDSTVDPEATVEHVMPQTIGDDPKGLAWKEMLGGEWEHVHSTWLDTLPNLTVTRRNSEMSNSAFVDKQRFLQDSKFAMTRSIGRMSRWSEIELRERADSLVDLARRTWALPPGVLGYGGVHLPQEPILRVPARRVGWDLSESLAALDAKSAMLGKLGRTVLAWVARHPELAIAPANRVPEVTAALAANEGSVALFAVTAEERVYLGFRTWRANALLIGLDEPKRIVDEVNRIAGTSLTDVAGWPWFEASPLYDEVRLALFLEVFASLVHRVVAHPMV